jgi:DNA polymerase-3 subunit gamma/tau
VSYLVLARKYRPSGFSSVSGQEHVTRTLSNAIARNKVVHAYLFTGPRGVGKTSVSRILSKALNCQQPNGAEPCHECSCCREISTGTSLAVREIDGASHNSVDNVRDLIDSFKALPPSGYKFKVYIIDEVHMLSISAFNALLKSLEEPPPNTVFILATTDAHKIPETVISRCQRHDFRSLSVDVIQARLTEVCATEKLNVEPEALTLIARLADGSMRDAQTLLDRVQTYCEARITAAETSRALGSVERIALVGLTRHVVRRDVAAALAAVSELFSSGIDPATLLKEFTNFWREIFLAKLGGEARLRNIGLSDDSIVELLRLVSSLEAIDVQDLWDLARDGADRCLRSAHQRYGFEALVARLATRQPVREIGELIGSALSQGGVSSGANAGERRAVPMPQASQKASSAGLMPRLSSTAPQAITQPVSASAPVSEGGALQWESFVLFATDRVGRIFAENLKRVRVTRFEVGALEGTGPEFTVSTILRDKAKLNELLSTHAGEAKLTTWKIQLVKGPGATDGAESARAAQREMTAESLESHPALQSLQKVFPGSKVEQVRVKNS